MSSHARRKCLEAHIRQLHRKASSSFTDATENTFKEKSHKHWTHTRGVRAWMVLFPEPIKIPKKVICLSTLL